MTAPSNEHLEKLGASMREIDPGALQPDADGSEVRWFLGEDGTELFTWTRAGKPPHHVQLVFSRVSVEWNEQKGLVTGSFPDSTAIAGGRYDLYVLKMGTSIDAEVCRAALTLLRASPVDKGPCAPLIAALEASAQAPPSQG